MQRVSLIEEAPTRRVRMAHLAVVGSHSTNGVAAIHSDLLRTHVLRDFAEIYPERFNNKTNGVTPRRWLQQANPASVRSDHEDDRRRLGHGSRSAARAAAAVAGCRLPRAVPQGQARSQGRLRRLAALDLNEVIDPDSIFDSQIKRIHEYKRQLLNILHVVMLYNRLRQNPNYDIAPHTFFFAGKAAPRITSPN